MLKMRGCSKGFETEAVFTETEMNKTDFLIYIPTNSKRFIAMFTF